MILHKVTTTENHLLKQGLKPTTKDAKPVFII